MDPSSTALFVIDIQHDLVGDPNTEIPHATRIREAAEAILSSARSPSATTKAPALIVFVQHEEAPSEGTLVRGSEQWKLAFVPRPGIEHEILVAKTTRSTFQSNPSLARQLKERGIRSIVAFGVQSECCVQETCKSALDEGFKVTLLQGAHSTYDTKAKSAIEIEKSVERRRNRFMGRRSALVEWDELGEPRKYKAFFRMMSNNHGLHVRCPGIGLAPKFWERIRKIKTSRQSMCLAIRHPVESTKATRGTLTCAM